jgi:hypothetical protein
MREDAARRPAIQDGRYVLEAIEARAQPAGAFHTLMCGGKRCARPARTFAAVVRARRRRIMPAVGGQRNFAALSAAQALTGRTDRVPTRWPTFGSRSPRSLCRRATPFRRLAVLAQPAKDGLRVGQSRKG